MLIQPRLQSELLKDQVAIVIGGSRGIGGATSKRSGPRFLNNALRPAGDSELDRR